MSAYLRIPDLVRDTQLQATFYPNPSMPTTTTHTYPQNTAHGIEIWTRMKRLDNGGNGIVWLEALNKRSYVSYGLRAVKELRIQNRNGNQDYKRELEALATFSQEKFVYFFVEFYGWFKSSDTLFIAMEYHEHGDLRNYIAKHGRLRETEARDITWQNILILSKPPKDKWRIKICDLGLSRKIEGDVRSITARGTPGFMPPELVPGIGRNIRNADPFPADVWCLGETVFKMLTCQATFDNTLGIYRYWKGELRFPWRPLEEARVSKTGIEFIQLLMTASPSQRLNAKQATQHHLGSAQRFHV
ncbi:kinase-like protein [Annulohypoxylon bovei var. microspora]|nr:kinase-like protein [Annulohypoxylon bovei var. microspora]